ncbi:MAG: hypothetical protein R3338_04820 [Thermoanaerobaculia bacterium]|nr:hypothetical protein [Thermoanaerobaculia bacterium]
MSEAEPEKVSSKRQDPDSDSAFVDSRQPEPASEEAIGEQFPEQASAPPSEAAGVLPLRQPKDVDESVSADSRPRRRSAEPEKKLEARTTALPSPGGEEEETFATQEATDLRTEETTTIRESGAGVQPRDGAGTLEYEEIHEMILDGELPDPEGVRVDTVVSHFDYGDRPPWRRGMVSVFMEGGAAPFSPTRWRTVRIGVRARESESPIASNARITLELDPDTVTLFRRIGDLSIQRVTEDSPVVIDIGRIPSDFSASWLLEVKLNPDVHLDQMIARTTLEYESDGRKGEIDRVLRVGHVARTWRTSSSSLQLAILAGVWAEILTGERSGAILDLTYLANQLRAGSEEARGLVRLIHRTEELRRDSDRQPHP